MEVVYKNLTPELSFNTNDLLKVCIYICNKHDWLNFKFVELVSFLIIPNCHFLYFYRFFLSKHFDGSNLGFPKGLDGLHANDHSQSLVGGCGESG